MSVANGVHGCRLGNAACRMSIPLYHFLTVVSLGEISIVTSTEQVNIVDAMVATTAIGFAVVELEPFSFATSPTVVGNEGALALDHARRRLV